jgi:hypothetical protein
VDAVAPMLGGTWSRRLGQVPDVRTSSRFGPDIVVMVANARRLPEASLRRRLLDAVDRQRFAEVVVGTEGRPVDSVVVPEVPAATPAWQAYGRGPPADVALDTELTLVYGRGEVMELLARFVREEFRRIGVDVELVPLDSDVLWGRFLLQRRFDLVLLERRSGAAADLDDWVQEPGAAAPLTHLRDAPLARLLQDADRGDLMALGSAQDRLAGLAAVLPVFQVKTTMAWSPRISGPEANPSVDGPLWNAWAWAKRRGP